ncbi:MAG: M1 family aminopeptidase [Pyrinomonadaceae bacterium]
MLLKCLFLLGFSTIAAFSQMPPIEPGVSHDLAKWRAAHYINVRYKLNLTLEKMSPVLKGSIEIRVNVSAGTQAPSPANAGSSGVANVPIILDWRKIKGHEEKSTVSNVSINGRAATLGKSDAFTRSGVGTAEAVTLTEENEHLIFRDGVVAGENVIKLDFTSPILTQGSAITRYVDKEDGAEYIYSLFVPSDASTAFPVFDQPDLKARFSLTVNYPEDWKIAANSKPSQELRVEQGHCQKDCIRNEDSFRETTPISTYVFAFAAGNFSIQKECLWDSAGLKKNGLNKCVFPLSDDARDWTNIYVRKSQAAKFQPYASEVFRLNREGIKFLESYFDYKFPFPKYDIVLIPEFPFGGMEHAGATFLREDRVIFPSEPTANDYITRANVIFHEAAHQWFGDTVTMKWFDDLWLKEGFAEFMAYKTLEKVMPEYNAWKVFYERNKQAAYLTDSTKGTTPIYQEIANLNSAKSAYGNIVYRKAPSFLKQAEFYIGEDKFKNAVRAFLKKHEYGNAGWEDLVKEFEAASGEDLRAWADAWIKQPGGPTIRTSFRNFPTGRDEIIFEQQADRSTGWQFKTKAYIRDVNGHSQVLTYELKQAGEGPPFTPNWARISFVFSNYGDYGYGIFLLDDKSRDYVLKNIQNEKDDFLRTMMWGSLWDSVREAELDPKEYVELVIKNIALEKDESTIQTLLGRVSTAMNYYLSVPPAIAGGLTRPATGLKKAVVTNSRIQPPATAGGTDLRARLEELLLDRLQHAPTPGQRITYFRAFVTNASTARSRTVLKEMLRQSVPPAVAGGLTRSANTTMLGSATVGKGRLQPPATAGGTDFRLRAKDRFDIVMRLATLGDRDAAKLLAGLEKSETGDDAKRYAYSARAGFSTAANKAKYWNDFVNNKEISESWIEAAMGPWNSIRSSELTLPYLERALNELPNHKRNRKIFFVNGWLGAFIGGQKSEAALNTVNKFLASNPNLDRDLRLKILENVDLIERAVKIRSKYGNSQPQSR